MSLVIIAEQINDTACAHVGLTSCQWPGPPTAHVCLSPVMLKLTHMSCIVCLLLSAPGDAAQVSSCCWLARRVLLCSKSDKDLQSLLFEITAKDGMMGSKVTPEQAAAAWVRLWLTSSELEREALLMLLNARTRLQVWCYDSGSAKA